MLSDIRNYLSNRDAVSVRDLALHFDVSPAAMQGMLNHWIRKGRVKRIFACGGCNSCDNQDSEIYTWVAVAENSEANNLAGCLCRG